MVIVDDEEPAGIGLGLKLTVTPLGWPEADKAIAESNPPVTAVVIVDVPLEPGATETEVGEAEMLKLAPDVTVKVTVAWFEMPPPVPMTVIV
jgi:hypothetical protein